MNKIIIFILTLLPVLSYSQVTSINIDTSASQVIIINNGTMIENNGGTVNVNNDNMHMGRTYTCNESVSEVHHSHSDQYRNGNSKCLATSITGIILGLIFLFIEFYAMRFERGSTSLIMIDSILLIISICGLIYSC